MLDKADPLVRSHVSELKQLFPGEEVLQYLLIDGRLQALSAGTGASVRTMWTTSWCFCPRTERLSRRREILDEVAKVYCPPDSGILHYDGGIAEGYS